MDRDRITGLIIIALMIVVYFQFIAPRQASKRLHTLEATNAASLAATAPQGTASVPQVSAAPAPVDAALHAAPAPHPPLPSTLPCATLSNDVAAFSFTSFDACMTQIELANTPIVRKGPIITATAASNAWEMPLRLRSIGSHSLPGSLLAIEQSASHALSFTGMITDGIFLRTAYLLTNGYFLHASLTLSNTTPDAVHTTNTCTVWLGRINHVGSTPDRYDVRSADVSLASPNGKSVLRRVKPSKNDALETLDGPVVWLAVRNKYFAHILVPDTPFAAAYVASCGPPNDRLVSAYAAFLLPPLPAGAAASWHATLYAGPKAYEQLKHLAARFGRGQDYMDILNLGWFSILAKPILVYGLKGLYRYTHNYGIAIIILTIIIKLLTWPLQTKSFDSMQRMQKLQPELNKLKEQFKDDPRKLQHEQMLLYRKHGVNPLGGCLPVLLQIPIFFALYQALSNAIELWGASFWWIKDLSLPDTVAHLPFSIPFLGNAINPLPLLMTAATIGQQIVTPHTGDKSQKQMMYMMPVIFLFLFYNMPSGLVLYWFVSQILSAGQMLYLHYLRNA